MYLNTLWFKYLLITNLKLKLKLTNLINVYVFHETDNSCSYPIRWAIKTIREGSC